VGGAAAGHHSPQGHLQRNRSVIVDLFQGLLRSQVRCAQCGQASVAFDPFTMLTLPLPTASTSNIVRHCPLSDYHRAINPQDVTMHFQARRPPVRFALSVDIAAAAPTFAALRKRVAPLAGLCPCCIAFCEVFTLGLFKLLFPPSLLSLSSPPHTHTLFAQFR
jgi:hypothetical protein